MEIERKYLIKQLPANMDSYPFHIIEQAYLCTSPVIRARQEDDTYYLTYKGTGMLIREEYNLPLNQTSYEHLKTKADGLIITKKRYLIPLTSELTIELDVFSGHYEGLIIAEIEFPTKEMAENFTPPDWFGEDVTFNPSYHNSNMAMRISS